MPNLYTHQSANIRKTWLLMTVFLVIVIGIGWAFSYLYDAPDILFIAIIFSVGMNIVSYWKSDKIALAVSGAKPLTKEENRELWNLTENLAITAGLPMPKLHIIHEPVPNAFATGRDKEHASIAVTTGLLQILDRTELEGVIAHELAHIGNKDILLQTVVVVLVGFIALLSDWFLRISFFGGRDREGGGNALFAIIGVILIVLSPIVATLIQLAISRKREFLADSTGALLTRYPEGLASALEKIHAHSGTMKKAHNATAHLFIANPFGVKKMHKGLARLFATHPPAEERITALRGSLEH